MKKTIILLFALLTTSAVMAQSRIVTVGECPASLNGKVIAAPKALATTNRAEGLSSMQRPIGYWPDDSITIDHAYIGAANTYPVGAYITNNMLRSYVGCKVVGVRFAVGESIGRTRAFIYKVQDGAITEDPVVQNQRTYPGWNNVFFNAGNEFELTGDENLIVGFDYTESEEMVAAETGALCTVGMEEGQTESNLSGNEFLLYGNFSQGEGWYPITSSGILCVQLIVDVSTLPSKAIDITYLDTGFRYKQPGESVEMMIGATNVGRDDMNAFELAYQLDDETPVTIPSDKKLKAGATASLLPVLHLTNDISVGKHTIKVYAFSIDGEAVTPDPDKVQEARFYVYAHPLARNKVYVEQYTDQDEPLADAVNSVFEQVKNTVDRMCMVNVYKPGNPLAIPESEYLTQAYAYTYPCFTSNRAYFPAEDYIAYDVNYYVQMVGPAFVTGIVADIIAQDIDFASFATIEATPAYDPATKQLTVDVSGTLSEDALPIYGDVGVTVLLTEDYVKSYQYYVNASNRTVRNNNYRHNNVLRRFMSEPMGSKALVTGDTYQAQFTTTLDDAWVPENLTLVAFVTRYTESVTADNLKEMDITNAESVALKDIVSGITEVRASDAADAPRYNLSGQRVSDSYRGIVVSKGRKYVVR
ncbi:MAG: Omp28-related outer membrane protein [Prevotella sp.]|nr:Omp28-related outer membrane protein [Prevotella sp.]